ERNERQGVRITQRISPNPRTGYQVPYLDSALAFVYSILCVPDTKYQVGYSITQPDYAAGGSRKEFDSCQNATNLVAG
ncbi:hypothetical protein AVEN_59535-1, partial [Araneus ventricosus]